jgi:hypothetical protein
MRGTSFSAALGGGLEFRLVPVRDVTGESSSWDIRVGPPGETALDFLWVVSPPFQTAPQRSIGNDYGLTLTKSVQFDRQLGFVLTEEDYRAALQIVQAQPGGAEKLVPQLQPLAKGSLTLRVTAYGVREGRQTPRGELDVFEWIEFEGRACIPR